jgi:hypothetical protein
VLVSVIGLLLNEEQRKAQRQKERAAQLEFDHAVKSAVSRIDLALKKDTYAAEGCLNSISN